MEKNPRIDGINIELVYHALMGMIREIKWTLQETWMTTNTMDRDYEYKKPKQTIRTSHCAVSVTHLPQQLENYIGKLPDWHQTAFLKTDQVNTTSTQLGVPLRKGGRN